MNSGSFFCLDLDSSKVVDGITIFDYIDFPDLSAGDEVLRYPVRLTITQDAVSFFVHYFQKQAVPHHSEEVILCLPFNSNDTERLSSTIKHIYNTNFPLSDHLYDCIIKRYLDKNDTDYKKCQDCQIVRDSYSSLAIWGLVEEVEGKPSYKLLDEQSKQNETDSKRVTKFLRKLLLDFMFDMMHSDVFECSKYYVQMKDGLMNDFFFSSIVKKSEYYYNRHLVRSRFPNDPDDQKELRDVLSLNEKYKKRNLLEHQIVDINNNIEKCKKRLLAEINPICLSSRKRRVYLLEEKKEKKDKQLADCQKDISNLESTNKSLKSTLDSIIGLYAEKLDKSEKEWIEVIVSPLADKQFTFVPEWFERPKNQKRGKDTFCVSETWFVDPEEEIGRVVFPLKRSEDNKNTLKKSFRKKGGFKEKLRTIIAKIGEFVSIEKGNILEDKGRNREYYYINSYEIGRLFGTESHASVSARNTNISKWFFRRYAFNDAFRLHFFRGWNCALVILLSLFSLVSIVFSFAWPDFWECPRNIALFPGAAAIICFFATIGFSISIKQLGNGRRLDDVLNINRRKRECCRLGRLTLFLSCLWVFLFWFESDCLWQFLGKLFVLIAFGFFLIGVFSKKRRDGGHRINNIHLLFPRLVSSITAAWIMLIIGNRLTDEFLSAPLCLVVSIIVYVYILYENNRTLPNLKKKQKLFRAYELVVISYSLSIIIGMFAIDILREAIKPPTSMFHGSWKFLKGCSELTLTIFPHYLMRFSFLAMFIGVFIQRIFEEKNITEI